MEGGGGGGGKGGVGEREATGVAVGGTKEIGTERGLALRDDQARASYEMECQPCGGVSRIDIEVPPRFASFNIPTQKTKILNFLS